MFRNAVNRIARSVSITRTGATTLAVKIPKSTVHTWTSLSSKFVPRSAHSNFASRSMSTEVKEKVEEKTQNQAEEVKEDVAKAAEDATVVKSTEAAPAAEEVPAFVETESEIDHEGNETLVVYQVDEDFITKCLREIRLSTLNAGLSLPILGLSLYSGSTAGVVVAVLAAILGIRAALRIISLASMPTKVTVAWPVNKTHVSNSLMEMLNLDSADESVESSFGELEYRSEMSQMAEHNQAEQLNEEAKKSKEAMKAKVQADAKNKIDASRALARGYTENPMFPSMLFEKVNFREVINTWRQLEDPDFPEVAFIERIGFGRKQESQISSKAHLNEITSLWFQKTTPDVIPFVSKSLITRLQDKPFDTTRISFVVQNTGTVFFGKYVRNVDAFNQLVFAANLNSRKQALTAMAATRK